MMMIDHSQWRIFLDVEPFELERLIVSDDEVEDDDDDEEQSSLHSITKQT